MHRALRRKKARLRAFSAAVAVVIYLAGGANSTATALRLRLRDLPTPQELFESLEKVSPVAEADVRDATERVVAAAATERRQTAGQRARAGECERDFGAPCPDGWLEDAVLGGCAAPATYAGICAPLLKLTAAEATRAAKAALAEACGVQWPCKATAGSISSSAACPESFVLAPDQLTCFPDPRAYAGPCLQPVSFEGFSEAQKREWADRCGATFRTVTPGELAEKRVRTIMGDCPEGWAGGGADCCRPPETAVKNAALMKCLEPQKMQAARAGAGDAGAGTIGTSEGGGGGEAGGAESAPAGKPISAASAPSFCFTYFTQTMKDNVAATCGVSWAEKPCPIDYDSQECPLNWEGGGASRPSGAGGCASPLLASGLAANACGVFRVDLSTADAAAKAAFAAACAVSWPCARTSECPDDRARLWTAKCPQKWAARPADGACVPGPAAGGSSSDWCAAPRNFAMWGEQERRVFASVCAAPWPCELEPESEAEQREDGPVAAGGAVIIYATPSPQQVVRTYNSEAKLRLHT